MICYRDDSSLPLPLSHSSLTPFVFVLSSSAPPRSRSISMLLTGRSSRGLFCCSGSGSCNPPAEEERRKRKQVEQRQRQRQRQRGNDCIICNLVAAADMFLQPGFQSLNFCSQPLTNLNMCTGNGVMVLHHYTITPLHHYSNGVMV